MAVEVDVAEPVRVRYAPSPTGEPHLGNIRTAMFNWLFARHHGGSFVVRIEDTDRERYVERAVPAILEALQWLDLDWDEGPVDKGAGSRGPYAPYVQSLRLPHYREMAETLLSKGAAYHCYCSPERLDQVRREKQRQKLPPGYDGRCRDLPVEERRRLDGLATRRVVRFRVPSEGTTRVDDLVRGEVTWENRLLDDFIILKSDGFPTYHLGVVTDDHLMEITHVLRAEEWLPSTPRHLMIYKALGWKPPLFGHLPMILGPDRAKLSKRHGADSALAYRDQGFLAEAAVNFLALLGWSLDGHTEVVNREELVSHFSLERVNRAPAVFNIEKLTWMNGVYIRSMAAEELAERLLPFLERPADEGGLPDEVARPLDGAYLGRIIPLVQERIKRLDDGPELVSFFFEEPSVYDPAQLQPKGMDAAGTEAALTAASARLEALDAWTSDSLEGALRPLAEELGVKTGQLFGTLRVAVTGRTAAPPLFETMEALGRERSLQRMRRALAALESGSGG